MDSDTIQQITRFAKYSAKRAVGLVAVVVLAAYATIYVANMGGYVDEIVKGETLFRIGTEVRDDPAYRALPTAEQQRIIEERLDIEIKRLGFDKPFVYRSFGYLQDALTLRLGRALHVTSNSGSKNVRLIILERLPATILLFTTTNMILFFFALLAGLYISRRYGSWLDKVMVGLSPLSSVPGWFYGIFLILIFASLLGILPYGGLVGVPPPETTLGYALSVMKHMILPVASWLVGYSFIQIYVRRTFFLIFSSEDYVELAKAKGLPPGQIDRGYVLRPTLPPILTDFALTLIGSWMGAIITERVFNWPGIGSLLWQAIGLFDSPVIIGVIIIYAYLLAMTVLMLDVVYAAVDPRIRAGVS